MNDSSTHRPRLICRLIRRWEALRGPALGRTRLTSRHLEKCDACQAFFAEDFSFEETLRSAARTVKSATAPDRGFEQRILRAVRESRPEPRKAKPVAWGFSLAGAVAGVALAVFVSQRVMTEKSGPQIVESGEATTVGQTPAAAEESLPMRWWNSLDARESALALAERNPLQQEIDSVYTDAQSVIGFLALNFLPTATEVRPAGQPGDAAGARQG